MTMADHGGAGEVSANARGIHTLVPVLMLALFGMQNVHAQGLLDRLKNAAEKAVEKKAEQVVDDALSGKAATEPVPPPAKFEMPRLNTGSQNGSRNCGALGTTCADGMKPLIDCMDQHNAVHYGELLAPALQRKLDEGVYRAGIRTDLEYDLKAVKAAAAPPYKLVPAEGSPPYRYLDWLTPEERADILNESVRRESALRQECQAKYARF
jgi:hypothetical protein